MLICVSMTAIISFWYWCSWCSQLWAGFQIHHCTSIIDYNRAILPILERRPVQPHSSLRSYCTRRFATAVVSKLACGSDAAFCLPFIQPLGCYPPTDMSMVPPTDTNDGAWCLPRTRMMEHDASHGQQQGTIPPSTDLKPEVLFTFTDTGMFSIPTGHSRAPP